MESIKKGWNKLTGKSTVQEQEEDIFAESWFDSLFQKDDYSCFSSCKIPFKIRMAIIAILTLFGLIALLSSFTFILIPMKFAKTFTVGNICILLATMFMRSIKSQINSLFADKPKLIAFVVYILSIMLVLFTALKLKSFILTLPAIIIEIIALMYYLLSYIPYGQQLLTNCLKSCGNCLCTKK